MLLTAWKRGVVDGQFLDGWLSDVVRELTIGDDLVERSFVILNPLLPEVAPNVNYRRQDVWITTDLASSANSV